MTTPSFNHGARGYMIAVIQRALGVDDDGIFGRDTRNAAMALQRRMMMEETGRVGPTLFKALKLPWPDPFDLCLNVVDAFEGTGFGGINDIDIDGAGVTMGIVGFTTKHGEVQSIMREFIDKNPNALRVLTPNNQETLRALISGAGPKQWEDFFYGPNGKIRPPIKEAVRQWGKDITFQGIQLQRARDEFWLPALASADSLGLRSPQGMGLMLDVHVQNGGWKKKHQSKYMGESQDGTEVAKLRAVARAVASTATPKWQEDVLLRKMTWAVGSGTVHGRPYNLENYGFEPITAKG